MFSLLPKDLETIVALATPRGSGAIALIRLSGLSALDIADKIAFLGQTKKLGLQQSHTIHHGFIKDQAGNLIDEVLFLLMKGPKTFTGQDTVEISCHNNQFIIDNIIRTAIAAGARQAKPGEFTMRGFLNEKFDLTQAESINEIIHAPSEKALQASLSQLKGSLSSRFEDIATQIIELLTISEASFEFLEEEQEDLNFTSMIHKRIKNILKEVAEIKKHFTMQQHIKDGIRIALIGAVNAGKSSLFNALIDKNRAIISNVAGTTRDSIEASLYSDGFYQLFIDTAGLRKTNDAIEQQGIIKSYEEALKADIILLVIDSSKKLGNEEIEVYQEIINKHSSKIILINNKADLGIINPIASVFKDLPKINTSTQTQQGIFEIKNIIIEMINTLVGKHETNFVLTQRQFNLMGEIEKKLLYIEKSLMKQVHYELVSYELKDLLEKTYELTGKNISEEILDTVFSKFCIGK